MSQILPRPGGEAEPVRRPAAVKAETVKEGRPGHAGKSGRCPVDLQP